MIRNAAYTVGRVTAPLAWLVALSGVLIGSVRLACASEPSHDGVDPGGAGHGGGGMPQLDVSTFPSQIFWLIGHGVVLYFLLKRVALPRIEAGLDQRRRRIEDALHRAEKVRDEAKSVAHEHEMLMAKASEEALAVINEAKAEIVKLRDAQTDKTRKEIADRLAVIEENIGIARHQNEQAGLASVEALAAQLAMRIAGLSVPPDPLRQEVLRHWPNPGKGH